MHFRIRGNNVQIVRTMTDEATMKVISRPVGSVNLRTGEMTDATKASLNSSEIKEAMAWVDRYKSLVEKKQELEFQTLALRIREVAAWVRNTKSDNISVLADDLLDAIRELRTSLSNARPMA